MIDHPPGTRLFLPSLLAQVRSALAPGFPFEPVIVQVLLLSIVAGDKNVILRTREEDIILVSKLTAMVLNTIFGYNTHKLKCLSNCANQTPSDFLRSLFFSVPIVSSPTDNIPGHKHRHRRSSNSRNSVGKLPTPSTSISTARSRRTSLSHPTSVPALGRPQLDSEDTDSQPAINVEGCSQRASLHPTAAQTDTSVSALASSAKTHLRNPSRGSTETLKLPSAVVVSGLELASLPSQKAVLRVLTERNIIVSDDGLFGHDQEGLTLGLPDGFFMVYVCRVDPRERPPIYKSLLDMFAMSSSIDINSQTRLAIRQFRPPSFSSATLSLPHTPVTSAAFPTLHLSSSLPGPPIPSQHFPAIPSALLQQLKHLHATQAHIRPPLDIYLADLFSATRHYGPLDAMMLTVRARQDAEALARASRVLGIDRTGAELIKEHAEHSRETDSVSTSTYPHSQLSIANTSSDALVDGFDVLEAYERVDGSSPCHSLASRSEQTIELDVSEADIARMFPRVVSHRIRVRDSPFDEILSSAVCGATYFPSNESQDGETVQWKRETVKDILVHILTEV